MRKDTSRSSGRSGTVLLAALALAGLTLLAGGACDRSASTAQPAAKALPELPAAADQWVNGAPVTVAASHGQVLFIEGWHPA